MLCNKRNLIKQAKSKMNRAYYQKRKERERQVYYLVCKTLTVCITNFFSIIKNKEEKSHHKKLKTDIDNALEIKTPPLYLFINFFQEFESKC